jgi:hypothetical protein
MFVPIVNYGAIAERVLQMQAGAEDLVILSYDVVADRQDGYIIYRGGVVAQMGPTTLKTDTLVVRDVPETEGIIVLNDGTRMITLEPKEAYAYGAVELSNPVGEVKAADMWFTWNSRKKKDPKAVIGRAKGVSIRLGSLWVKAESAEQTNLGWTLKKVSGSTCVRTVPLYGFQAKEVNLVPGKQGKVKHVRFSILGQPLPDVPTLSFSLDQRTQGLRIPQLSYRQRDGFGVAWNGSIVVDDQRQFNGFINAFPKLRPVYTAYYSQTKANPEKAGLAQFVPISDFGERAWYSYFETIFARSLDNAKTFLGNERNTWTVGTTFNVGTFGRQSDLKNTYSKPFEAVYERSGVSDGWSLYGQSRLMTISEDGKGTFGRASFLGSAIPPVRTKGRLTTALRFDGGYRLDPSSSGWLGGEAGFSYEPLRDMKISAGAYGFKQFGTPLFAGDRFISDQGFVVRGDILGSATKLSMMWRYDPTQGWFDRQIRLSQVVGCIEPVFVYRGRPNDYQLGIRFRIDAALGLLQQRNPKQDSKGNKPIP